MSIEEEDDIQDINPYEILKIKKDANIKEIKKAYHKLCLKYHPDKNEGFRKEFDQVQISYLILSDEKKRSMYDATGIVNLKVNDDDDDDDEFDWHDYFKSQFESISKELIEKDREEYQGSEEEIDDIKKELINAKGDMKKLFETVIHLEFTIDEEKRIFEICENLIKIGDIELKDIPKWKVYVTKRKDNIQRMERKRRREEKEAEKVEKERGGDDDDDKGLVGLQALIAKNSNRHRNAFDDIAAKYEREEAERRKSKKRRKTRK